MKKGFLISFSISALLFILGGIVFFRYYFIPKGIDINKLKYPITGIDVSRHTGTIDFQKIEKQDIHFIYQKATEGVTFVDPSLHTNYKKSKSIDIPFGFYHFFRFNKSGKKQAINFLSHVKNKKTLLPYVVDVEDWGNPSGFLHDNVTKEVKNFIEYIEKETDKRIIIYSNEKSYRKYLEGHFDEYDLWICSFKKHPNVQRKWTFWQHSHKGKIDGVNEYIDLNTFNGSKIEWIKYLEQ